MGYRSSRVQVLLLRANDLGFRAEKTRDKVVARFDAALIKGLNDPLTTRDARQRMAGSFKVVGNKRQRICNRAFGLSFARLGTRKKVVHDVTLAEHAGADLFVALIAVVVALALLA